MPATKVEASSPMTLVVDPWGPLWTTLRTPQLWAFPTVVLAVELLVVVLEILTLIVGRHPSAQAGVNAQHDGSAGRPLV